MSSFLVTTGEEKVAGKKLAESHLSTRQRQYTELSNDTVHSLYKTVDALTRVRDRSKQY